jgi:hypothetical protein
MEQTPDFTKIEEIANLWRRGILSSEEALESIHRLLDPKNYLPAAEAYGEARPSDYMERLVIATTRI